MITLVIFNSNESGLMDGANLYFAMAALLLVMCS
jgi:hypothetical protein